MSIIEALENAITLLESLGYKDGDIHNDLEDAISRIKAKFPNVAGETL